MTWRAFASTLTILALLLLPPLAAAVEAPYTEGTVWNITFVKVKLGFRDDYLRALAGTLKVGLDEAEKEGEVLSYRILSSDAASPEDWNIAIMIEYKNMAALDGLDERIRKHSEKIVGPEKKQRELFKGRLEIRDIIGAKLARELILK